MDLRQAGNPMSKNSAFEKYCQHAVIGRSLAFVSALSRVPIVAGEDVPVLIQGETGTGKEVVARAIHYMSRRSAKPFVAFQCGATPIDLLENELFGHQSGAFTGATSSQVGVVESAEGGTLLLDEIDTLPLQAQSKILRLLQERQYRPLGTGQTRKADIRILSTSNVDLRAAVKRGDFREDCYYRLNVMTLKIPPLRERCGDILILARHFVAKYSSQYERPLREFSAEALRILCEHDWPGNVRELEYAVQRAVLQAEGDQIGDFDLGLESEARRDRGLTLKEAKQRAMERAEKDYVERVLAIHGGNIHCAANQAGLDRRSFYRLICRHRIDVSQFRDDVDSIHERATSAEPTAW